MPATLTPFRARLCPIRTAKPAPAGQGGGGRESNPPGRFRTPNGVEDHGAHQALIRLPEPMRVTPLTQYPTLQAPRHPPRLPRGLGSLLIVEGKPMTSMLTVSDQPTHARSMSAIVRGLGIPSKCGDFHYEEM